MKRIRFILSLAFLAASSPAFTQEYKYAPSERVIPDTYVNTVCNDAPFRVARKGILVVGDSGSARAVSPYSFSRIGMVRYAQTVNTYRDSLGSSVHIFCMPIPTAAAFYVPDSARSHSSDERPAINVMFAALHDSVQPVNIFTSLSEHAAEPIYSRTDHHWAPLGAYYAAQHFAEVAGVPFDTLADYDTIVSPGYVGTMYNYSRNLLVKQSPEDFVTYIPRRAQYRTFYNIYKLDKKRQRVVSESDEQESEFFKKGFLKPESISAAYCVFGGGDYRLIKVKTAVNNGRRLIILKDSFGNALTAYLLNSFEEIHVIDCRYFTQNIRKYVAEHGITDILFANNMSHAQNEKTTDMYLHYLVQ